MPGNFRDADVKCPFYKYIRDRSIFCDLGSIDGIRTIGLMFTQKRSLDEYISDRCVSNFKNCPVYQILMDAKYSTL